ncbi:MAG: DUF2530 domain-containing protein [Pseudonocardiaceae bacterium]
MAPPLPSRLADPRPIVGVGTLVWFLAAVVLLVAGGSRVWIWACLTGGLLGLSGFAMIHWQGSAARRAQRKLF